MAKITIELDTSVDTLETVLKALHPPLTAAPVQFRADPIHNPTPQSAEYIVTANPPLHYDESVELAKRGIHISDAAPEEFQIPASPSMDFTVVSETEVVQESRPASEPETLAPLGPMDGERKRGESLPKGRRRTKAQIEEDERYFSSLPAASEPLQRLREIGAVSETTAALISTGEPRVSPEDEAQDAADEAAESAATASDAPTTDDLRKAVGRYTKAHGIARAQRDVPIILGKSILEIPPEEIAEAIVKLDSAIPVEPEKSKAKFTPVDTSKPVETVEATSADVNEAILSYAKKYDGVNTMADHFLMIFTGQDVVKILQKTFGENVRSAKHIEPKTPVNYGKALTAINDAIVNNPFKRTPK
ncbi:MAG: hypothetical protein KGL39_05155 [Patescibacteria group bacterium]|nr:hypothetical protein [Patescibacteria group bacterium]